MDRRRNKRKLIKMAFSVYAELEMKKLPNDSEIEQEFTENFEKNLWIKLQEQDTKKRIKQGEQHRICKAVLVMAASICIMIGITKYQNGIQDKTMSGVDSTGKESDYMQEGEKEGAIQQSATKETESQQSSIIPQRVSETMLDIDSNHFELKATIFDSRWRVYSKDKNKININQERSDEVYQEDWVDVI